MIARRFIRALLLTMIETCHPRWLVLRTSTRDRYLFCVVYRGCSAQVTYSDLRKLCYFGPCAQGTMMSSDKRCLAPKISTDCRCHDQQWHTGRHGDRRVLNLPMLVPCRRRIDILVHLSSMLEASLQLTLARPASPIEFRDMRIVAFAIISHIASA